MPTQTTIDNSVQDSCFDRPGLHVLGMGAGVQTTATLLKYGSRYDHVIFADTGDEYPETYYFIDKYLKPHCEQIGVPWHTVKNKDYDSLMDKCFDKKIIPMMHKRWCTDDFKIKPIQRKLKELGATAKNPINHHIGISMDESHRVGSNAWVNKPKYQYKCYPLIEDKISRADCHEIIKDHGWPSPPKSGCDFCPYAGVKKIRAVAEMRPERFAKIMEMEANATSKNPLAGKYFLSQNHPLLEFEEESQSCDSGHCFN